MCKCAEVKPEDVAYRTLGRRVLPYHKDCQDWLSEEQAARVEKDLVRLWGIE